MHNTETYLLVLLIKALILQVKVWNPEIGCLLMGLLEFSGGMIIRLDPLCSVDGKFVSAVVNLEKIVDLLT